MRVGFFYASTILYVYIVCGTQYKYICRNCVYMYACQRVCVRAYICMGINRGAHWCCGAQHVNKSVGVCGVANWLVFSLPRRKSTLCLYILFLFVRTVHLENILYGTYTQNMYVF